MAAVEILREAAAAAGLDGSRLTQRAGLRAGARAAGTRTRDRRLARGSDAARRTRHSAAARAAGAQTAVITVSAGSPAAALAGIVVETGELDHGWCHTIGYLSPVVAAAAVGAHLSGRTLDAAGGGRPGRRRARATRPARSGSPPGSPTPRTSSSSPPGRTGRRAASWCSRSRRQPGCRPHTAISRPSCTATCRRPAADTGLVLILTDRDRRAERLARARQALAAARVIGLRSAAIVASGVDAELDPVLTPAGRLVDRRSPGPAGARRGVARERDRRSSS